MIKAVGATHVIIGHSERRQYFGETDETVLQADRGRARSRPEAHRLRGRAAGRARSRPAPKPCSRPSSRAASPASRRSSSRKIVIAYEPVWAIGTGKTATPEIAADAHTVHPRAGRKAKFGDAAADAVRILYGGSVKPDNMKSLMAQPDIDGVAGGRREPRCRLLRRHRQLLILVGGPPGPRRTPWSGCSARPPYFRISVSTRPSTCSILRPSRAAMVGAISTASTRSSRAPGADSLSPRHEHGLHLRIAVQVPVAAGPAGIDHRAALQTRAEGVAVAGRKHQVRRLPGSAGGHPQGAATPPARARGPRPPRPGTASSPAPAARDRAGTPWPCRPPE